MAEKLNSLILSLKEDLWNIYPDIIMALVVLAIGYIMARIVRYMIIKSFGYVENVAGQKSKYLNLNQSAKFIASVFFGIILLMTGIFAADILGLSIVTNWMEEILSFSPNILAAILIVTAAVIFGKFTEGAISTFGNKIGLERSGTLGKVVQFLIILTAAIIAVDQLGFEVKFLIDIIEIAIASILFAMALAFGLGARASVSNILASYYIRKKYKVGDKIRIGEIEGFISSIDATKVVLKNEDGQYSIPSKEFNESTACLIKNK